MNFTHVSADTLDALHASGFFSHLDYYLSTTLGRIFKDAGPLEIFSAALTCRALSRGCICLDLAETAGTELKIPGATRSVTLPELAPWRRTLENSAMVGVDVSDCGEAGKYPLVLDPDNNLYLSRYHDFQCRLLHNIRARIENGISDVPDDEFAEQRTAACFDSQDPRRTFRQQQAVKKALCTGFLMVSGGPGTGKTYITDIIQRLLIDWADEHHLKRPGVICLAPTGKAASRLKNGMTIHSALKPVKNGTGFRHNAATPLPADLVIIDEASMIDMALMTRLFEAIRPDARIVMLGDVNQLSPVQAGAVFFDLCQAGRLSGFRVFLDVNFRSGGQVGIEQLAMAVNRSDADAVSNILGAGYPDVRFVDTDRTRDCQAELEACIREGYRALWEAATPEQAIGALDDFRVLCAHNSGSSGTLQINHLCGKILRSKKKGAISQPVFNTLLMVRRNDYKRGLRNGDTCVVLDGSGGTTAWFAPVASESGPSVARQFRCSDLPECEPGFAVTIHKSQGSEFDTVVILIPEHISPVVTRQLLYTGITRSRKKVVIFGSMPMIRQAVQTSVERRSNLRALLDRA